MWILATALLYVTTLADSGPGSLRAAVEAKGPRTIHFRVAGEIHLQKPLAIREPFVTIDASTAPAPGITLRDNSVFINTHDVTLRHLRSRPGDKGKTKPASNNQRNPRLQNGVVDVRNNVFYNSGSAAGYFSGAARVNFVGNLYIAGPDTRRSPKALLLTPEVELYLADSELHEDGARIAGWDMVTVARNAPPRKAEKPFPAPHVATLPLAEVDEKVLAGAGATLPVRDFDDQRVVRGVREKTNRIIDTPEQTALRVTGEDLAWKVENAYYIADLSKNPGTGRSGQINTIYVKDPGILLTRARPTSSLHLSPNAAIGQRWNGINRWDPPARYSARQGPGTFRVEREGAMPFVPNLRVKTAYEFSAASPEIVVEESVEATGDAPVALLRLCEWSVEPGDANPFTHVGWEDAAGNVVVLKKEKEQMLPLGLRWMGFSNEARRFSFAVVMDKLETSFLFNPSSRFSGDPHYFHRILVGAQATVPKGSRYAARYRVIPFRPRDPSRPFAELKP